MRSDPTLTTIKVVPQGPELGSIDCCAHPMMSHSDDIREFMPAPWKYRSLPGPEKYEFVPPFGEYHSKATLPSGLPGSDPELMLQQLTDVGIEVVILLPLGRGLHPNIDLSSAICSATNEWLVTKWLDGNNPLGRVRGTIRIDPRDPEGATREIERWGPHPLVVQVGVPTQTLHPYGQRMYHPVWKAAAEQGLPVAVYSDGGASIRFKPSAGGHFNLALERAVVDPLNFVIHVGSLIAEGVFARFPDLRFVFADGGFDFVTAFGWRFDKDWRPNRDEMPWNTRFPSAYIADHVRFCTRLLDGPSDPKITSEWLEMSNAGKLLIYGSHYPYWDFTTPQEVYANGERDTRRSILAENAREFYAL